MARPNTTAGGRPQADRAPIVVWLKDRLSKGPVPAEVLQDEVEQKKLKGDSAFNKKALHAARLLLPEIITTPKQNVHWWMDTTVGIPIPSSESAQEISRTIRDEREYQRKLRDKEILVIDDLIQEAQGNRWKGKSSSEALNDLVGFWYGNDWDEPISYEQVIEINRLHGPKPPKPLTDEEIRLNNELDWLTNKSIQEISDYVRAFRNSHKRLPSEEENREYRKYLSQDLNSKIQQAEFEIKTSGNRYKRLLQVEIQQHPDVVAFHQQNDTVLTMLNELMKKEGMLSVRKGDTLKRLNKELETLEARLEREDVPLSQEEVNAFVKKCQDDIVALRIRLSDIDSEVAPAHAFLTDAEKAHIAMVRNLISKKMVESYTQ